MNYMSKPLPPFSNKPERIFAALAVATFIGFGSTAYTAATNDTQPTEARISSAFGSLALLGISANMIYWSRNCRRYRKFESGELKLSNEEILDGPIGQIELWRRLPDMTLEAIRESQWVKRQQQPAQPQASPVDALLDNEGHVLAEGKYVKPASHQTKLLP